jgi:hypothetical protein
MRKKPWRAGHLSRVDTFRFRNSQKISAIKFCNHKLCMPRNPVYEGSRTSRGILCAFNHAQSIRNLFNMNGVKYDSYI